MEKHKLNISVSQLAEITTPVHHILCDSEGNSYLQKEYEGLVFIIDYPMHSQLAIIIPKAHSIADILVPLADAYKNTIYKDPEKFQVYGHSIGDLFFEGIVINDDGTTDLRIGS